MEVFPSSRIYKNVLLLIFFLVLLSYYPVESRGNVSHVVKLRRDSFSRDFLFGAATSALQIEGPALGKKGPTIWDYIVELDKGKIIKDVDKYPTMIEHYKRYKEDVKILKKLGINAYRFSIQWSRILPDGTLKGGINQEGIDFYNNLIDELIANGMTPFVTIMHFDYPLALYKSGGFLNHSIVHQFKDYSELLFKTYGDRVKHWTTLNEPEITALYSYMHDVNNPNPEQCQKSKECKEAYIVAHNFILCHATAAKLYREKFQAKQGGEIGIVVSVEGYFPYSSKPEDVAAAHQLSDFFSGWILNPLVHGDYPKIMKKLVKERLPVFTKEEKKLNKGSVDFIGINYYRSYFVRAQPNKLLINTFDNYDSLAIREGLNAEGKALGYLDQATKNYMYPEGLSHVLLKMKKKYKNPKFYITENGITSGAITNPLHDKHRQDFHVAHLKTLKSAMDSGAKVHGYFIWAAFDTFEFMDGFTQKSGIVYVDFQNNLKRTPKSSAVWYRSFLSGKIAI